MDIKYLLKEARYYKKSFGLPRMVKKFLLSQTALSKFVNTVLYNSVYSGLIKRKVKNWNPKVLQIENTNVCNAKCIMCPHSYMKRRIKTMSLEDFEKIADNVIGNYELKRVTIGGFGEPFADRGIIEKIKYLNEKYPKLKIDLYTNASLLTKELADKLLKTKIDRLTFSINGTEENYERIVGLDYDKTKGNASYFLEQKRKLKQGVLTNVSLMILKENEKDIKKFLAYWKPLADSVRVYAPSNWAGNLKKLEITKKPPFTRKRWTCPFIWNNITVDVEGNLVICHRDCESKVTFGNLLEQDINKIRNSEKFCDVLQKHSELNFNMPMCRTCDNCFDSSIEWWM